MSGSAEGYKKARMKLIERYGGEAGLKRHQEEIGRIGGARVTDKSKKRGFGSLTHERLVEVAARGGRNKKTE